MISKQTPYQMHLFAVLIRVGSFTLAAEQLNMTRSWLSQQISALEATLNKISGVRVNIILVA